MDRFSIARRLSKRVRLSYESCLKVYDKVCSKIDAGDDPGDLMDILFASEEDLDAEVARFWDLVLWFFAGFVCGYIFMKLLLCFVS